MSTEILDHPLRVQRDYPQSGRLFVSSAPLPVPRREAHTPVIESDAEAFIYSLGLRPSVEAAVDLAFKAFRVDGGARVSLELEPESDERSITIHVVVLGEPVDVARAHHEYCRLLVRAIPRSKLHLISLCFSLR